MAKKKRRKGPSQGSGAPAAERPDRRPAPAAEALEPAPEAGVPLPTWRWHAGVFLACLATAAFVLWGVYVPIMRYHSRKHMRLGDEYFTWAKRFDSEPGLADSLAAHFDSINEVLAPMAATTREYQEWWTSGDVLRTEEGRARSRAFRERFGKHASDVERLRTIIERAAEEARLYEAIPSLRDRFAEEEEGARVSLERLGSMALSQENTQLLWPLFERFKSYVQYVVRLRNCFERETALDEAMSSYLDAVAFGRRWAPPRMKLADLYAYREWHDMAGEEYAKVVRIDPRGRYGEEAVEKLRALAAKEREVNFHLGAALLARGEHEAAAAAFQEVVDGAPAGLYAPKAEELVALARSGDRRRIEDFVADQLFL